jgi:hypothetical protein
MNAQTDREALCRQNTGRIVRAQKGDELADLFRSPAV